MLDYSTTAGSASALPDGTIIVDGPVSTNGAAGQVAFSNLAPDPAYGSPASSGNASPGLEAFEGSNLLFTPQFDQEIFGAASVGFPETALGSGILSAGLDSGEGPGNFGITVYLRRAEGWDFAALALTGLVFALAGAAGRNPRVLRRLMGLENRHTSPQLAAEIDFYIETRRRMLSR
jgi:hypothetical protein